MIRFLRLALFLLLFLPFGLPASDYKWMISDPLGTRPFDETEKGAVFSAEASTPGNFMIFLSADRNTFRHDRAIYDAGTLRLSVTLSGNPSPLRAWIFAKDKEGSWYQSRKEYSLAEGANELSLQLDNPDTMLPIGHSGTWNSQIAAAMFEFGLTVISEEQCDLHVSVKQPEFTDRRCRPELKIMNWRLPSSADCEDMFESRFSLSREYFNPFDPDEIRVDYEYAYLPDDAKDATVPPDGAEIGVFPAFYAQDFSRSRHFTQESVAPAGAPYWAFRMMPHRVGDMLVRIVATDRGNPDRPETVRSEWRRMTVRPSANKGPVRVSRRDPQYFEFSNGDFFYPVGLNIHANTDFRSEMDFPWHHVADRKSFDYEDYFNACGAAGINLVEVWMATWTCAIEWNSGLQFFYGVGRYNQANSWRLDHMFRTAANNGIFLNLVFDSHGRLSKSVDQEWDMNPYNNHRPQKVADGAFLNEPRDYYTDENAIRCDHNRTRYIMARWGAFPNLFASEFMSEINLVESAGDMLGNDTLVKWCRQAVAYLRTVDQGNHMVTIHCSGDCDTTIGWRKLFDLPEFTHVVGDAYRGTDRSYLEQLRIHRRTLSVFANKPVIATEYGEPGTCLADIHSGVWGSMFYNQAGNSCLWWHDFVHIGNRYNHYQAFARFIEGLDLRGSTAMSESVPYTALPAFRAHTADPDRRVYATDPLRQLFYSVDGQAPEHLTLFPNAYGLNCYTLMLPAQGGAAMWIHRTAALVAPPEDADTTPAIEGVMLEVPRGLAPGKYRVTFHNTWKPEILGEIGMTIDSTGKPPMIVLPPFHLDIACKILPVEQYDPYAHLPWIGGK